MEKHNKKGWQLKVTLILVSIIVSGFALWFAYEICFNFEEFTSQDGSSTGKQKIYYFILLSVNSFLPYGNYVLALVHLLIAYPFLKFLYKASLRFVKK